MNSKSFVAKGFDHSCKVHLQFSVKGLDITVIGNNAALILFTLCAFQPKLIRDAGRKLVPHAVQLSFFIS